MKSFTLIIFHFHCCQSLIFSKNILQLVLNSSQSISNQLAQLLSCSFFTCVETSKMYSSSSNYILCYTGSEFYSMHYTLHQPKKEERRDKLAICVHGLTRNETDFNYLVTHLASEFTLICPDVVGSLFLNEF